MSLRLMRFLSIDMNTIMKKISYLLIILFLSACNSAMSNNTVESNNVVVTRLFDASPKSNNMFKSNYVMETFLWDNPPKVKKVELLETKELDYKIREYQEKGYTVIGRSKFSGVWEGRIKASDFAKKIGANVVLFEAKPMNIVPVPYNHAKTTLYDKNTAGMYFNPSGKKDFVFVEVYHQTAVFMTNSGI